VRSQAVEIDPLTPDGRHNGSVVVAAGKFYSAELQEDDFLKPGPYLILRRHVEMYQWQERTWGSDKRVRYEMGWIEGQVDFFKFKETEGHENPLMRYENFTRYVSESSFGAFNGAQVLKAVTRLIPVRITAENLKDPGLKIEENRIIIPRAAGGSLSKTPELGDTRIWYEALPQGDYTILTRQVDERNLVGASSGYSIVIRVGRLTVDDLFKEETRESERISDGLLYVGGFLFFIGLYSVLAPIAPRINLRPKINLDGAPALALLCAALSAVAVIIFFVVGRVG
jgi:hypothetical protein